MPPSPAARAWVARTALVTTTAGIAVALSADVALPAAVHVSLVLVACCAFCVMLGAEARWGGLSSRLVAGAIAVECFVSVSVAPRATGDLWWYAIYGRIVAVYHANPYVRVPASFPHDPLLRAVGTGWAHTPSVYGPLFTGYSSLAATVTGLHLFETRLCYQLLAVGALLAACSILWRRTHRPAAIAFFAVNPVVALYLLNGGRNDILVGAALLGAVVLACDGRDTAAGVVAGLGSLVKVTGLVGVGALVVSTLTTRGRSPARRLAGVALALVTAGYLLAGPDALLTPMDTAGARYSTASIWRLFPVLGLHAPSTHVALVVAGSFALFVTVGHRGRPGDAVVAAFTALTLGAAYALPGYVGWALPVAALSPARTPSRVAALQGVVLVAVYELVRHPLPGAFGAAVVQITRVAAPLAMLALAGWLAVDAWKRRNDHCRLRGVAVGYRTLQVRGGEAARQVSGRRAALQVVQELRRAHDRPLSTRTPGAPALSAGSPPILSPL